MAINTDIEYVMNMSIEELSELYDEVCEISKERNNRRK